MNGWFQFFQFLNKWGVLLRVVNAKLHLELLNIVSHLFSYLDYLLNKFGLERTLFESQTMEIDPKAPHKGQHLMEQFVLFGNFFIELPDKLLFWNIRSSVHRIQQNFLGFFNTRDRHLFNVVQFGDFKSLVVFVRVGDGYLVGMRYSQGISYHLLCHHSQRHISWDKPRSDLTSNLNSVFTLGGVPVGQIQPSSSLPFSAFFVGFVWRPM